MYKCCKYDITFLPKKAKLISRKNILKDGISVIPEKYDIHPRRYGISVKLPCWLTFLIDILKKIPMILCTFYGHLYRRFYTLLSCEKKPPGNIIYWIEFNFFFNLYGWRYSTMKILQYSVPFNPQDSSIKEIICPLGDGL